MSGYPVTVTVEDARDRLHLEEGKVALCFTKGEPPGWQTSNVEHLTLAELAQTRDAIDDYLRGRHE